MIDYKLILYTKLIRIDYYEEKKIIFLKKILMILKKTFTFKLLI